MFHAADVHAHVLLALGASVRVLGFWNLSPTFAYNTIPALFREASAAFCEITDFSRVLKRLQRECGGETSPRLTRALTLSCKRPQGTSLVAAEGVLYTRALPRRRRG